MNPKKKHSHSSERIRNYNDFKLLSHTLIFWISEIASKDNRHQERIKYYGFHCIGRDDDAYKDELFSAFYGSMPVRKAPSTSSASRIYKESGGSLDYSLGDNGLVAVRITPRKSDNQKVQEDGYFISFSVKPKKLLSKHIIRSHWKVFSSYIEVTAIDGAPTYIDRVRVGWLRFTSHGHYKNGMKMPKWKILLSKITMAVPYLILLVSTVTLIYTITR